MAPGLVIHVAAGALVDRGGRILLQQRARDRHQGGLWEFPGGKVEPDEGVMQALRRELAEELAITVERARPLIKVRHDYPDCSVLLDVFLVTAWSGAPVAMESQPMAWVDRAALADWPMPAADRPVVTALQLPAQYPITPEFASHDQALSAILSLPPELTLLRIRQRHWNRSQTLQLVEAVGNRRPQLRLMVDDPSVATAVGGVGLHLKSRDLHGFDVDSARPLPWLAASVHHSEELALAQGLGVDFVTASAVQRTLTHPDQVPLGWPGFQRLAEASNVPVYALGGMGREDIDKAWAHGAQGISGIGAYF